MATANVARWNGDDYQARWFWYLACELLEPDTKIEKIGFEDPTHKAFDDVSVYYKRNIYRTADFHQVKFHVNQGGSLSAESLIDPKLINASSVSLLARAYSAYKRLENSDGVRFYLYTPWQAHPDDILAELIRNQDGQINLAKLAEGGARSKTGKLRAMWMEHLSITDEAELMDFLNTIRISDGPTLVELGRRLKSRLIGVGLKPADPEVSNEYDSLARDLVSQNRNCLTRSELEEVLKERGLWLGGPRSVDKRVSLGIRSRMLFAEDLGNKVEYVCCVCEHFPSRHIRQRELWNSAVYPSIAEFVQKTILAGNEYLLRLDAHSSIAFSAGHLLPSKVGAKVSLVQKSFSGGETEWSIPDSLSPVDDLIYDRQDIGQDGEEVAIALSISQDVRDAVLAYVSAGMPQVGQVLFVDTATGPGATAVTGAGHAAAIAQTLAHKLRGMGVGFSEATRLHLFAAAPNGFIFFFGRFVSSHPYWTLYEYDLEGRSGYVPSISLPPPNEIHRTDAAIKIAREKG